MTGIVFKITELKVVLKSLGNENKSQNCFKTENLKKLFYSVCSLWFLVVVHIARFNTKNKM